MENTGHTLARHLDALRPELTCATAVHIQNFRRPGLRGMSGAAACPPPYIRKQT